jgi:hypothetical protein
MIDARVQAAQQAFSKAVEPYELGLAVAQGRRSGLDRASLTGKVPDYVRTLADRRVSEAQEALDNAKIPALEAQIKSVQQALDLVRKQQADFDAKAQAGGPDATTNAILAGNRRSEGDALQNTLDVAVAQRSELQAAKGATDLLPTSLADSLHKAATAFQEANQTGLSFTQMLSNNMGEALSEGQGLLTNFFGTLIQKPQQALAAFGSMVQGIIKYAEQLAAKLIATKIFDMLLSIGASVGAGSVRGLSTSDLSASVAEIKTPLPPAQLGLAAGGVVMNGEKDKDTVSAKLARGEFVMQRSAVDSLGPDFLKQMNKRGAAALDALGKTPVIATKPSNQQMSVYVVAPDSKPSMGPNDVLLVINDDILKGGQTKQLIKHVAQGG